jgi:ElaB/YqjD/DUF883 family membrane-anchored ribosome-binding protein
MAQLHEDARGKRNGQARTAMKSRATDVLDDFAELRKDLGKLADATNKAARAEVKQAGRRLELFGRDMRERAEERMTFVGEQVRTHPGAALGLTLGAGLLLGMILTRRR